MLKKLACMLAACVVGLGLFCGCGDTPQGTFYTLQEAYDSGYLTREDLMSIAYYHNGGREGNEEIMAEDYAPLPKNPEVLSEETEQAIKEAEAYIIRNDEQDPFPEASADGIEILNYFGRYSGCYVVKIGNTYYTYPTDVREYWIEVGEVRLHMFGYNNMIKVWKRK